MALTVMLKDRSATTTLLTASRSNFASFPTQEPVETSANSTGGNSHKNVVPAAVGGSLGALAVIVLVFLYIFLRRRKRRKAQLGSDSRAEEENRRHARNSQEPLPTRELAQNVQRTPANPFADRPKNSGAATHGAARAEDSYSEYSSPFNLDRDFDGSRARPTPWRSSSNDSQYSHGLDPRSTNSSFSGHRASLRRTNSSQWRADRGMSTYSDPFDLEKLDLAPTPQMMDGTR